MISFTMWRFSSCRPAPLPEPEQASLAAVSTEDVLAEVDRILRRAGGEH
ncbi:MAG TPA: hypothetical protein VKV26_23955 [Dehalococcoidia bacterium]|nr:hypothetical protein [Dehalococcoidia bacterium]